MILTTDKNILILDWTQKQKQSLGMVYKYNTHKYTMRNAVGT